MPISVLRCPVVDLLHWIWLLTVSLYLEIFLNFSELALISLEIENKSALNFFVRSSKQV